MPYFLAVLFSIFSSVAVAIFFKTYQLCGYKISPYFSSLLTQGLAFGDKNKLIFTKRLVRIYICYICICSAIHFCIFLLVESLLLATFFAVFMLILTPILLMLVHFLMLPCENIIKCHYIHLAKKKLQKFSPKIIGITGSYGKTSTKNILAHLLSQKFSVCATPKSFNTEMGLTRTIMEKLSGQDFLIAEMGARKIGDIKKLCTIAPPDFCLITTIGKAHLESFCSEENIIKCKSEIIENSRIDAPVFVNCDSESGYKIYNHCIKPKFALCRSQSYAYASDINFSSQGSTFTLNLGQSKIKCKTKLLGRHNINNIVCASALAVYLGLEKSRLASAIKSLQPTPHRLELKLTGSVAILDDSYNSNLTGAREALYVLSSFAGRKIVVTPGIVELGEQGSSENFKLGTLIAESADFVIIMNEINKNYILSGLIAHNFDKNNIFFANSRQQQKNILSKIITPECAVLFENDLPDNYK